MKKACIFLLLSFTVLTAFSQKTPEQLGGIYHAYEVPSGAVCDEVPGGYVPFYISHYGRHGSRWLPSDSRYEWVLRQFEDVSNLTRKGKSARKRLLRIWKNARGNGGKLTSLGAKQHRGIARRMLRGFPSVFTGDTRVEAHSSVVGRCIRSMDAFVGELRSRLPSLQITTVADSSEMIFLSYDSPELKLLQQETRIPLGVSPGAFVRRLFKDTARVSDGERLLSELFAIASDMQDIEDLDISLYDLFAEEEMTALYAWNCAKMFHQNGTGAASRDIPARCAANLWRNIVDEADEAIASGRPYVNLRFGHDTALYRLLSLLRASLREDNAKGTVENPLDEIVPMAANLQMIFCHDRAGRVTVGFFLNEKPACLHGLCPVVRTPGGTDWYMWDEVKVRYRSYIDGQR